MPEDDAENSEKNGAKVAETSDEMIECGVWTFPWLTILSLYRLTVYINKLYQDSQAVSVYYNKSELIFCIISASCLFIPSFVYMLYLIFGHVKREDGIKKREAGTKIVDGLLLIPWQIKSIVEVLHFSVQRVCHKRSPSKNEKDEHSFLERRAMVLEFFEDFFAGFIQLSLQMYIILTYYYDVVGKGYWNKPGRPYEPDTALYGEIVASGLTLTSMLFAVRRKDDGCFFTVLSIVGWAAIMGSRAFTIALAASVIHLGIMGFCLIHAIIITMWITPICLRTYSETQLSRQKICAITFLVFFLFGLPSLVYWPFLFHLKANKRPLIFLAIITIENIGLFCIWYFMKEERYWDSNGTMCIAVVAGGTCVGCLFLIMYVCIKPTYTDQVALHDMRTSNSDSCGIYYDFCELTFQLNISTFVETNLQLIRNV